MRRSDIITGCLLTALGLFTIFHIIPQEISGTSDYGLAPDFFPLTLAWLATGLSALLVALRLLPLVATGRGDRQAGEEEPAPMERADFAFIGACAVFLILGYYAMEHVGFLAAGAAIIAVAMVLMGGWRNKLAVVGVSLVLPFVIDQAFRSIFLIYLP